MNDQAAFTELVVAADGSVRTVYSELVDLHALGRPTIRRGSHVEPTADGRWTADLSPVAGPLLGPFDSRSAALTAELSWLREFWLCEPHARQ